MPTSAHTGEINASAATQRAQPGATEAPARTGYGIVGMRERAGLLHGDFRAGPRPEGGFKVTARLPLPEADPAGEGASR